jgi:hypoxanthine phosphoribosyltransferase
VEGDIEKVLFTEAQIRAGVERIAAEVAREFEGGELTVVAVLKGSCIFVADLIRRLSMPLELAFAAAQSYRAESDPGALELQLLPAGGEIEGRRVLLVDDILDSGNTLCSIRSRLLEAGAMDVVTCVLLDKPARRVASIEADFRVFEVDDLFVVGYGLDFAGRYRNLPYVAALRPQALGSPVGRQSAEDRA